MTTKKGMVIAVSGVTKTFAGVKALDQVSIELNPGKVHGLIGANGAGKSTLIKILAGVYQPDSGKIMVNGEETVISNPHESARLGLSFIHQDLNLVQNLSIRENITLGLAKSKIGGMINWNKTELQLKDVVEQIGIRQSLKTPVKELSLAEQWLVAIARALYQNASFIAMDEPTASLTEHEVQKLFSVIDDLVSRGIGVIYVSHRLDEIMTICDEITVFKDGRNIMHSDVAGMTKEEIINAIAGQKLTPVSGAGPAAELGQVVFRADKLSDGKRVAEASFELHQGEVLGLTGLVGSGRTELAMMMFGARKAVSGHMQYQGRDYRPRHPAQAVESGVVLIPEDRRTEGLFTSKTVSFNLNITTMKNNRYHARLPFISRSKEESSAGRVASKLQVKTNSVKAPILSLSGGNQQKVVIGKWLSRNPALVMMDEPTRGVDVGARSEIYKIIHELSEEGISFLIISSDVEELPGLCDRVLIMVEGRITGEVSGEAITKDTLIRMSYGQDNSINSQEGQRQ